MSYETFKILSLCALWFVAFINTALCFKSYRQCREMDKLLSEWKATSRLK